MEKYFLCFPRANDYLTNITIVTWLFLILFQITNETLPHFQDEMFLLVIPETEKFYHFFTIKIHLSWSQKWQCWYPSSPLANYKERE